MLIDSLTSMVINYIFENKPRSVNYFGYGPVSMARILYHTPFALSEFFAITVHTNVLVVSFGFEVLIENLCAKETFPRRVSIRSVWTPPHDCCTQTWGHSALQLIQLLKRVKSACPGGVTRTRHRCRDRINPERSFALWTVSQLIQIL